MITSDNLLNHELIGLRVTIKASSMTSIGNTCGKIIYETKKMIVMDTGRGMKAIPKKAVQIMKVELPSGVCFISGCSLIARPEDRILRMR